MVKTLSEFTSIADDVAAVLAGCKDDLDLSDIVEMLSDAASALAKYRGVPILLGLTALSDAAAEVLATHIRRPDL